MTLDLGIVIVSWNVRDWLTACLDSVYVDLAASGLRARVCVVDNGSHDGSAELVRTQFPNTQLIEAENRGMGAGNNLGLKSLIVNSSPFAFLILNPDTFIHPGALRTLVDFLRANPQAGVAAPKLVNADGTLQHSGFQFPGVIQATLDLFPLHPRLWRLMDSPLNGRYPASFYTAASPFRVDFALGAALAVRAEAVPNGELFDESFFMYCEEIDAQWRLQAKGWETWLVPGAEIVHLGGRSSSQVASRSFVNLWTSRRKLYRRYHGPLVNALVAALVHTSMRQRIRANHRASQNGLLPPDRRAELNAMLNEVIGIWSRKRNA
ncbi:MAG: glycosyltransferase family 2 protein [Anaerolineales bacterium]|nr:glycosyltransferase family 2 protein [Anaerolineales bacterium]